MCAGRWATRRRRTRTDRIALLGHSAGAYNVLMLALDPRWLAGAGVPEAAIGGVASLAGPADFYPFTSDSARNALGHAAEPELTQPVHHVRADAPPIFLLHGTADDVVRVRNSRSLAEAIRRAGGPVETHEYDGMGHAGIVMGLSKPFAQGGAVRDPLVRFLRDATAPATGSKSTASVPVQRQTR
ncbi:alpha/beta hydrolase [Tsuneonella sp. SYSU-LHT278]|uniref:alpha/beta hydrolase n=1 Tax=Tsuneonella sediminis TaxID=3416089 RepID=UPI003F7A98AB